MKIVHTVAQTASLLGLSRNATYDAIRRKEIPSVKFGRRIVVPAAALQKILNPTPSVEKAGSTK